MFLGSYTISDLIDLLNAKDAEMKGLDDAFIQVRDKWQNTDPNGYTDFSIDYANLKQRYSDAKLAANIRITASKTEIAPASTINADTEYNAVLSALAPGGHTTTKGDLVDLVGRVQAQGGKDTAITPQPTAIDIDEQVFLASDAVAKATPSPIKSLIATVAPTLVPKDATQAQYQPVSKLKLYGGIALAAIAGIFIAKRI